MNKDGNTKKQATRKREREKKENSKKEEEIKEHDGPKSSRGEESRRHKTSCSVTCPFNVPVEANEKWRPYSLPLRPFNRGYLPLCYDSKTSLGSPRSSLIYEPTTVPFVIPPSLYLLSPPLLLYFSISFRLRIAACHRDTSLMPRRECTVPAHRTLLSIPFRSRDDSPCSLV